MYARELAALLAALLSDVSCLQASGASVLFVEMA